MTLSIARAGCWVTLQYPLARPMRGGRARLKSSKVWSDRQLNGSFLPNRYRHPAGIRLIKSNVSARLEKFNVLPKALHVVVGPCDSTGWVVTKFRANSSGRRG